MSMVRRSETACGFLVANPSLSVRMILWNRHPKYVVALLAISLWGCSSARPTPTSTQPQPAASSPPATVAPIPAPAAVPPQSPATTSPTIDTLGPHPRPTILVPGQNNFAVRTKLVPRVIGNGWILMVNKTDSLEFLRTADSALTPYLFGIQPGYGMKLRLRFILKPEGDGTRISLMGHLVGKDGQLPYVAQEAPLVENLNSLQAALLAAPPMQPPEKPGKKNKK